MIQGTTHLIRHTERNTGNMKNLNWLRILKNMTCIQRTTKMTENTRYGIKFLKPNVISAIQMQ